MMQVHTIRLSECVRVIVGTWIILSTVLVHAQGEADDAGNGGSGDGVPGWRQLVYCRRAEGNVQFSARWFPDRGMTLGVRERESGRFVSFTLNQHGIQVLDHGAGDVQGGEQIGTRFIRRNVLKQPRIAVDCILKFRANDWSLYVDDALCAVVAAPFEPPADVYEPDASSNTIQAPVRFRPVPLESFRTDFMIEEGAPNQLYPWNIESGQWRIHTAMEDALARPESDLNRIKQVPLTPDKSPNFYSLKGGGKQAIITTGYDFFDDYVYAASMQVNDGEVGLVFYHRDEANHYGFTIFMSPEPEKRHLRLWRVRDGKKDMLARVQVPLFLDQWYMPKVAVHTDEIVCYLDDVEVMRVTEWLPSGGKIGLFADAAEEIRFDDVYLEAFDRLPTATVGDIRYQTLHQEGGFYRNRSFWRRQTPAANTRLEPPVSNSPQHLVLGRAHHRGAVFSADYALSGTHYEIGLVAGFRSPDKPYYRFILTHTPSHETYQVSRIRKGHEHILETWTLEASEVAQQQDTVSLMVDASETGVLRFLKNDSLVSVLWLDAALEGGAGPVVGPGTRAVLSNLSYALHRDRTLEQEQKNPVFQQDSFMRHWASPEGQWIGGEGGLFWHKGDFLGDFTIRLPCISGSELHVGVPDGEQDGPVAIEVTDAELVLRLNGAGDAPGEEQRATLTPPEDGQVSSMDYELHHEGYWLWVQTNGKTIIKHRLTQKLTGTRCRIKGLELPHLARSKVTRTNVIDDFFNESPHKWVINGGEWQIVNRFQCTPSWSHMVGQSDTGMAALWYKTEFQGDLTLEFYAGTRQGWYDRAGDLNCTIMADTTSVGRGYTITCTEWDQNLSQNWSTLYRNGEAMERSDEYLVPRRRKGMVRKILNPLISAGRPIHGAWYYVKVRKIGEKLEYYFDNEKIFEYTDPEMINDGLVGIWTFMHSMTVAQVKFTFQNAVPRTFPVTPLRPYEPTHVAQVARQAAQPDTGPETDASQEPQEGAATALAEAAKPQWDIAVDGVPLDSLEPAYWSHRDEVGQSHMQSFRMNAQGLRLVNRLGGGRLFAAADLPPVPLETLAGWRFLLKRTPEAMLNFHYTVGTVDAKGEYKISRHYFHHITGPDFSEGSYVLTGSSDVPPADDIHSPAGQWTEVTVWVPSRHRTDKDGARKLMVRVEGVGLRQPSVMMCGMPGNGPGEGYAMRQLTPIFYGVPELSRANGTEVRRFALRTARAGEMICEVDSLEEVQDALKQTSAPGFNRLWIKVFDNRGNDMFHDLFWIDLPDTLETELNWHPQVADTMLLRALPDYVDRRFCTASVSLDDTGLTLEPLNSEERLVRLPRQGLLAGDSPLRLEVDSGAGKSDITLNWTSRPANRGPVLLAFDGLKSGINTFENGAGTVTLTNDGRMQLLHGDPQQHTVLQVQNRALNQRLAADFTLPVSVAEFPLLQFRYRAFDMAHLTVSFKNHHAVRLGDDWAGASRVRLAEDLVLDGAWRTWQGVVADAFTREPFAVSRFLPTSFRIASAGNPDQTGRYSKWQVDDMVFGPAVTRAEQLAITPVYDDVDGIAAVLSCVSNGATSYADLDASVAAELSWQSHEPGVPLAPTLDGLADGVHHLFIKAVDTAGMESTVTDMPFLLDTRPLEATYAFGVMADPASNGRQLTVTFDNHGGAPWAIEKASFSLAGSKQALPGWTSIFRHGAGADRLILNYPFIFRSHLDNAKDGDSFELTIDDIVDGAGNASPPLTIPITVDHAADKTGPSWYAFSFGAGVAWFWNWDGYRCTIPAFSPGQHNTASIQHTRDASPFLVTQSYRSEGDLSRSVSWQPAKHPWVSFRVNQPDYSARRDVTMHLVLSTNEKTTYTISLTKPGKEKTELNRTQTIEWKAGEWQRLSFNVRDMLKEAGVSEEDIAKMMVNTVTFRRRGTKHQEALHIDDFFLHGVPAEAQKPDVLKWRAYDASGVASLEVICVDADGKDLWSHTFLNSEADLNVLRPKVKGAAWFRCQAKDKAGNLSPPFWLPLAS